jgi:hypothetical protein
MEARVQEFRGRGGIRRNRAEIVMKIRTSGSGLGADAEAHPVFVGPARRDFLPLAFDVIRQVGEGLLVRGRPPQ